MESISWTPQLVAEFKKAYDAFQKLYAGEPKKQREGVFYFTADGVQHEFVAAYAKYLIEYLENAFVHKTAREARRWSTTGTK